MLSAFSLAYLYLFIVSFHIKDPPHNPACYKAVAPTCQRVATLNMVPTIGVPDFSSNFALPMTYVQTYVHERIHILPVGGYDPHTFGPIALSSMNQSVHKNFIADALKMRPIALELKPRSYTVPHTYPNSCVGSVHWHTVLSDIARYIFRLFMELSLALRNIYSGKLSASHLLVLWRDIRIRRVPLNLFCRRTSLLKHDYQALVQTIQIRNLCRPCISHWVIRSAIFSIKAHIRSLYFRLYLVPFQKTYNIRMIQLRREFKRVMSASNHSNSPQPLTYQMVGGTAHTQYIPFADIEPHVHSKLPEPFEQGLTRLKFVAYTSDTGLLEYPAESYIHASVPVSQLLSYLTKTQAQKIARLHGLKVHARSTSKGLAKEAECHQCSMCTSHYTVFHPEPSAVEQGRTRAKNHKRAKKCASRGLDEAKQTMHTREQSQQKCADTPPPPLDRSTRDRIVNDSSKRMHPEFFEEKGCAVCGELKPLKDMSKLKSVKNILHVLVTAGVTRKERKDKSKKTQEYTGPVLDYSCDSLCKECRVDLRKGKVPRLALANNLWLGSVPKELKALNYMEKLLISRVRHTCAYVKVASGQRKMKANVVAFEAPIPKMYSMLPPPREDFDDVLAILFTGPCKPTTEDFKRTPLLVRRNRVLSALEWLKLNHSDYSEIAISVENLNGYSEDEPPVSVEYRKTETNKVPEGTSVFDQELDDGTEEGQCLFTVHGLTAEALDNMPAHRVKATALRHLNSGGKMLAVGHNEHPESIYKNPQLYPQMFPWLFPYGLGGIGMTKLSDKEHKRHLLMYHDKRFQRDIDFPFVAFCHEQMKTSSTQSFLLVDQSRFSDISEHLMNIDWNAMDSITKRLEEGEHVKPVTPEEIRCFKVIQDLDVMSGKMHGSTAGKKIMRNEIWALISRLGAPIWYITLSPADNRHPLCIYLAGSEEKFNPIPSPYEERARLVCSNPVAGARFFHFMVETFVEDVLGFTSKKKGAYGYTDGYYGTVEQQGRLTLHLHLLLWIKGTLSPQELREKLMDGDSLFQKKIIDYLESCFTGDFVTGDHMKVSDINTNVQKQEGYVDPTESLPIPAPPSCALHLTSSVDRVDCLTCKEYSKWEETYNNTVDDLLLRSNVHSCQRGLNKDGSRKKKMASAGCMDNKWGKCKARFPRGVEKETYVDKLGAIFMKKTEQWINTFTPLVTYIFRCNTDVTSLASGTAIKAVVMYVSDYITKTTLKTHTIFDSIRTVFHKSSEMISGSLPMKEKARRFMTKIVNLLSAKAEMGAPMICMYLLGNPDHYTSHQFVPFYWQNFVSEVRKYFQTGEPFESQHKPQMALIKKRGRIVGLSPVLDYIHRPCDLEEVNLYEWVRCYERFKFAKKKGKKDNVDPDTSSGRLDIEDFDKSFESIPESVNAAEGKRGKNTYAFNKEHPLYETHGIRFIANNELRVPNFIGATLPRCDTGDREYYCCTMLTLFKIWRKGTDLKPAHISWDETFDLHAFTDEQRRLMKNFNIRYECMDARDDYRAQMKKGAADNLFTSWDPTIDDGEELPDCPFQPPVHSDIDEVCHTDLQSGPVHLKRQREMELVRSVLCQLGWTNAQGINSQVKEPMQPSKVIPGSEWDLEVERSKQKVLDDKHAHIDDSKSNAKRTENRPMKAGVHECNVVKVVDKTYLQQSFMVPGYSELVTATVANYFLNREQERAFRVIANHAISPEPSQLKMYLGGMGGTGKSQVLKALAHFFTKRSEAHRFVVVAPTGTAAALLGGSTYHSLFGIFERVSNKRIGLVKERLKGADYVFFDEVSMLSARDLYRIHSQLCKVLGVTDKPFGGLNMVFSGDFAQLPPAIGGEKVGLYSRCIGSVASDLKSQEEAIGKALWHQITTVVILRQNMRQRSQTPEDAKLRTALENMRYKACTAEDIAFLKTRISSSAPGRANICEEDFRNVSIITGTNLHKDEINRLGAIRFAQETGQTLTKFYSDDTEKINTKDADNSKGAKYISDLTEDVQEVLWSLPPSYTDKHIAGTLTLCVGMPVMIRHNYATELCMTRGQEGYVVGWQSKLGSKQQHVLDTLFIELKEPPSTVRIDGLPENVVPICAKANAIQVMLPGGTRYHIQRKQVEVLVNFAMTDFASQGKTRQKNVADLHNLGSHQAYYTALSRSATAAGTLIMQGFDPRKITGGCSGSLRQEFRELELLDYITLLTHEEKLPPQILGETRNELIRSFREWKGEHFVPKEVHKSIRWSKKDPLTESEIIDYLDAGQAGQKKSQVPADNHSDELFTPTLPPTNVVVNKKRRISQVSSASPKKGVKKPRPNQVSAGTTRGFRWQNNSCAYDSVFTILLCIWTERSPTEIDSPALFENNILKNLLLGFRSVSAGVKSLEQVRDEARIMFSLLQPTTMQIGQYTSADLVFQNMLTSDTPATMHQTRCSNDHIRTSRVHYDLFLETGRYSYPSTANWIDQLAEGMPSDLSCRECDQPLNSTRTFLNPPPVLALEWSSAETAVSTTLRVPMQNGRTLCYSLKGVIYFGSGHFVALTVDLHGQLWFYDGMRRGGDLVCIGDLLAHQDLRHMDGKVATAAIYVPQL